MLIVVTAQPRVATLTDMMQPLTGPEESGPECRPGVLYNTALHCSTLLYYCTDVHLRTPPRSSLRYTGAAQCRVRATLFSLIVTKSSLVNKQHQILHSRLQQTERPEACHPVPSYLIIVLPDCPLLPWNSSPVQT